MHGSEPRIIFQLFLIVEIILRQLVDLNNFIVSTILTLTLNAGEHITWLALISPPDVKDSLGDSVDA